MKPEADQILNTSALQLLTGITFETIGARLAVGAHIGGFFAGMLLARPLLLFRYRNA